MRVGLAAKVLLVQLLLVFCASELKATPCIIPPLAPTAINQFKSDPQALVAPNADARTIERTIRDLAGTDASLAAILVNLAERSDRRFQTAIAAGLAQAAVTCQTIDQNAALLIQQAVATFEDGEFQNAFAAVAGDLSTAAVAAALDSANASVGSVVITNPNRATVQTTNPGAGGTTALFQITSSVAIAPVTVATTTTTTTTTASPVSPTR